MRSGIAVVLIVGMATFGVSFGGSTLSVDLLALPGASVSGQGFWAYSTVYLVDENGSIVSSGLADSAGNITFENVPEGDYTLEGLIDDDEALLLCASVGDEEALVETALTATADCGGAFLLPPVGGAAAGGGALLSTPVLAALAAAGLGGVAVGVARSNTGGSNKTTICHIPPGNPSNPQTITVNANAVAAHQAQHGDTLGACPASP